MHISSVPTKLEKVNDESVNICIEFGLLPSQRNFSICANHSVHVLETKSRRKRRNFCEIPFIFNTHKGIRRKSDRTLTLPNVYTIHENFGVVLAVEQVILNFLRIGELHLPSFKCGPSVKKELEFWGIGDDLIERCCWNDYNSWNATLLALKQLEKDRKGSFFGAEDVRRRKTCCGKYRDYFWSVLNCPSSSTIAKVYGWVCLFFVVVSIFSFMAETHPAFRVYSDVVTHHPPENSSLSNSGAKMTQSNHNQMYINSENLNNDSQSPNVSLTNSDRMQKTMRVKQTHPVLDVIDIVCLCFFTIDFLSRLCVAKRILRHLKSMATMFDFLALLPDYVEIISYAIVPELQFGSVGFIQILRIARVLRVFRLIRHVPGLWILIYTLKASFRELLLMSAFLLVGMLVFSSLIYFVDDQETFTSIPHGFWWAIITMTTVGYGDMYPKTNLGYLIGSFCALSGLLMIGFSVPVLVNNFIMYYKHVQFAMEEEEMKRKRMVEGKDEQKKKDEGLHMKMIKHSTKKDETEIKILPQAQNNNTS